MIDDAPAAGNRWWKARVADERLVGLAQQAPFRPAETQQCAVLDFHRKVRGTVNLISDGPGDGSYDRHECHRMLAKLQAGELEEAGYATQGAS